MPTAFLLALVMMKILVKLCFLPSVSINNGPLHGISLLTSVHPSIRRRMYSSSAVILPPPMGPVFISAYGANVAYVRSCSSSAVQKVGRFCRTLSGIGAVGHPIHVTCFNSSFVRTSVFATSLHRVLRRRFNNYKIKCIPMASSVDNCHPAMHRAFKK